MQPSCPVTPPAGTGSCPIELGPWPFVLSSSPLTLPGACQRCRGLHQAFCSTFNSSLLHDFCVNERSACDYSLVQPSKLSTSTAGTNAELFHSFESVQLARPPPSRTSPTSLYRPSRAFDDNTRLELCPRPKGHPTNNTESRHNVRSLTVDCDKLRNEMTTITSPPNSPPDLSGSKSSKSSSYNSSSQFSSPDGILTDVSNFEDIGLHDERESASSEVFASNLHGTAKRPRPLGRAVAITPRANPSATSHRDLIVARRSRYPSLHGQVNTVVNQRLTNRPLQSIPGPTSGRAIVSASTTSLPSPVPQMRPRSSSPKRRVVSVATSVEANNASLRPIALSPRSSLPAPLRRSSWQPNRKSIIELEAEYHDSDDELPDEASLWNVPLSPRPREDRTPSLHSSARGSPERDQLPPPIPLSHTISAPAIAAPHEFSSRSLARNTPLPRTSSPNARTFSASHPSSPQSRSSFRAARAKSWTMAMSELSEEVRVLNEILEYHHSNPADIHVSGSLQNRPRRDSTANYPDSMKKSLSVKLPPVQASELDFMPISKEKQAMLSRTRPSWLPPKSPREERRHLKEYQQMMVASMEAEKRRDQLQQMQKTRKDDSKEALSQIWEQYVCPSWNVVLSEHRTRELWWRGVSPKVRGHVWQRAIGNSLALTEASYIRASNRAQAIKTKGLEDLDDGGKMVKDWFEHIDHDVENAFPELNLFQKQGPLRQDLVDVCEAYVCYRSDVGYLYGLHLIAALLLLQLSKPPEVFVLLANCLNRATPLAFLTNDTSVKDHIYDLASGTLAIQFPRLHNFLFSGEQHDVLALTAEEVFEPMFRTMFANGLDLERLCRVWDCWVFEGDGFLVQTAVGLLGALECDLLRVEGSALTKKNTVIHMLAWGPSGRVNGYWNVSARGGEDEFMRRIKAAGKSERTPT